MSFNPLPAHPLLLIPRFSPGLVNCFNSLEESNGFWNGTVVYPPIDIKYGFSDPSDLEYFNSQVDVMEERWQAFGEVCLKHENAQFLPYVGTTATVRDLVAIAEYFDGKGCDINYYGLSYGTTIGNYLINSELTASLYLIQSLSSSLQCSQTGSGRLSWTAWRIPSLTLLNHLTSTGPVASSPPARLSWTSLRGALSRARTDALSPQIRPQGQESSSGPRTCSGCAHSDSWSLENITYTPSRPRTITPDRAGMMTTGRSTWYAFSTKRSTSLRPGPISPGKSTNTIKM